MNYNKVLVRREDKKECKRLKNLLKDRYKVALYKSDNSQYERYLNRLRDSSWNDMIKPDWYDVLYEFGRVRLGKTDEDDDESTNDMIVKEPIFEESVNNTMYSAETNEIINDESIVNEPITESCTVFMESILI